MKRILHIGGLIILLSFFSCQRKIDCTNLASEMTSPHRTESICDEKIYNGHIMPIDNRFDLSCIYFHNREISEDIIFERKNEDLISLKLLNPAQNKLKNNDTLNLYFADKRKAIWKMSAIKLVNLVIKKEQTPCDSVFNIIYQDISGKIADLLTKESITVTSLYDRTLKNKIKQYISTLSKADSIKFYNCQKEFFILDLINRVEEFGFVENEYYLTPRLESYLNRIAESIAFSVNQHNWNKSQFLIECIGYADRRQYTGSSIIDFSKMGIRDPAGIKVSNTGCGFMSRFEELTTTHSLNNELNSISDNCDLSILRGFVSAVYLQNKLKELTDHAFIFQYKGGGEVPNDIYDINRKIDIYLEIKGVSEK